MAIPINTHIAIDLGFRVRFVFRESLFTVEVPVGYFGLKTFI